MTDNRSPLRRAQDFGSDWSENGSSDADTARGLRAGNTNRAPGFGRPAKEWNGNKTSSTRYVTKDEVVRKIRYDYGFAHKDPSNRILDTLVKLMDDGLKSSKDLNRFLNEVAAVIDRQLQIRATTIGVRDPKDGRYRYVAMSGLTDDQWQAHKVLSYSLPEFHDPFKYRGSTISNLTKLFLVEDSPYNPDEMATMNARLASAMIRKNAEDCNEGDYFDIYMKGPGDELLGWIEISGTKYGRMPDANVLRWIEMIATMLGLVLAIRGHGSESGRH